MPAESQRCAAFRLEVGGSIGLGHLARCAALSRALGDCGWKCVLWTNSDATSAPADMYGAFDEILAVRSTGVSSDWDWIVIDDYAFDDRAVSELRQGLSSGWKARLLVIDDEAKRKLRSADLVLNTRLGLGGEPYAPGVPVLLGERYALLRSGIANPDSVTVPFPGDVEPVLVVMGGTDPGNLAATALHALADIDPVRFAPVVVRRHGLCGHEEVGTEIDRFAASVWLDSLSAEAFAGWAMQCRWAISAAGGTVYELAALGVPMVAVVVAANQRLFAGEANARWKVPIVDATDAVDDTAAEIQAAFNALIRSPDTIVYQGIDGRGPSRVARKMVHMLDG